MRTLPATKSEAYNMCPYYFVYYITQILYLAFGLRPFALTFANRKSHFITIATKVIHFLFLLMHYLIDNFNTF